MQIRHLKESRHGDNFFYKDNEILRINFKFHVNPYDF